MLDSSGDRGFPIWLVGDSPPSQWEDSLDVPLDPRHPARHSIWTPIESTLQEEIYKSTQQRLNTRDIFTINAIDSAEKRPLNKEGWSNLEQRIKYLDKLFSNNTKIIITFGSFAFEMFRRITNHLEEKELRAESYWTCKRLGEQFRQTLDNWNHKRPNVLPLLHVSIARGKFLDAHRLYCPAGSSKPNYFEYVGRKLGKKLITEYRDLNIWL